MKKMFNHKEVKSHIEEHFVLGRLGNRKGHTVREKKWKFGIFCFLNFVLLHSLVLKRCQ